MEENKEVMDAVVDMVNEVADNTDTTALVPSDVTVTDLPPMEVETGRVGIGKVMFIGGLIVAAVYGGVKIGKKLINKRKAKKAGRKYATIRDDERDLVDESDYVDEGPYPEEFDSVAEKEEVEA